MLVVLLVALAAWGTLRLKHSGEAAVAAERDLQSAFTELYRQDALEWRMVSGRVDPRDIAVGLEQSRDRLAALVETAEDSQSDPDGDVRRVAALQRTYAEAVDRELALYAAGKDREAEEFDEDAVDPAFDALADAMASEGREQAAYGRTARRLSDVGLVIGVVLALLAVGLLLRRQRRLDIHREAERRGESRYQALIDQSADLVVVTDRAGRVLFRSPAAERATPKGQETDNLLDVIVVEDRGCARNAVAEVGTAGPVALQSRVDTAAGHRVIDWTLRDLTHEPQVAGIVWTGHDVSERHLLQAELEHRALHDALTGLPNRALLADRFEQALGAGAESGMRTGLLLIDLDRFKEVNDTLGHHVGDELLIQVSRRLASTVRAGDTVARLGGDEFAVLLPAIGDANSALGVAESLHEALTAPFVVTGADLDVDASIGVVLSGRDGNDASVLLQRADIAMYAAKHSGLPVAVYDPGADHNSPQRLSMLADLRRALAGDDELCLVYQPKIDLRTGDVCGVEALLRWQHPTHGSISPEAFIPLAENTGLIGLVAATVLRLAVAQAARWAAAGQPLQIAVNLSARNLLDERLVPLVEDLLASEHVSAGLLKLEVTETAIMADPERARSTLGRLSSLGIALSIDDFGVGYTSLAQLKRLPISELKIDRTFVQAMATETSDRMIVRSVVELGHNLGLTCVAEGVESEEALRTLIGYSCDVAQGYHLCHPLAASAFDVWRTQWPGIRDRSLSDSTASTLLPRPRTERAPTITHDLDSGRA
ncbi:bifunctional diguanylate cyclase/phosphodiesterase [Kineosporia sp. R_H_3]|uniref:putative bifunctional diguanylate cyclase/phosphodiesterase n=1 Tax=Kineosporia sp. R_H_3 TaxID=1961848 RepID=UPI00117BDAF9|nr:GGDEF domain-containing phosphodiesterase [Kineosporia sp. R_H_3]